MQINLPNGLVLVALQFYLSRRLSVRHLSLSLYAPGLTHSQPGSVMISGGVEICCLLQPSKASPVKCQSMCPAGSESPVIDLEPQCSKPLHIRRCVYLLWEVCNLQIKMDVSLHYFTSQSLNSTKRGWTPSKCQRDWHFHRWYTCTYDTGQRLLLLQIACGSMLTLLTHLLKHRARSLQLY